MNMFSDRRDMQGKTNAPPALRQEAPPQSATDAPSIEQIDPPRASIRDDMLALVPRLRGFAVSLCGNMDHADDLVQETLVHALTGIHSFRPGTNLSAWLFTILRNLFRSEFRKRRREVEDADGNYEASLISAPAQDSQIALTEFRQALTRLPDDQREALVLVGASGFSYQEAAVICDIPVGTIKSRVHRARLRLSEVLGLELENADDAGIVEPHDMRHSMAPALSARSMKPD
jgi:RNA polymerase sigma-70 factor (ECF subfamily)